MVLRAPVSPTAAHSSPVPLGPVAVPSSEDAEAAAASAQVSLSNGAPAEPVRRSMGAAAASTVPGVSNGIRRIFQEMTGAGLMRRNPHPPGQPSSPTPRSSDPARPSGTGVAQRPPQPEEIGLDIPTFLRRQSN